MTSRERVGKAINHQSPDRVPRDLGTTLVTGIHASTYAKLKKALGITEGCVRIYDPFQILAEVERNVEIFSRGGGYIFTPVHNIQANVPVENILAAFD